MPNLRAESRLFHIVAASFAWNGADCFFSFHPSYWCNPQVAISSGVSWRRLSQNEFRCVFRVGQSPFPGSSTLRPYLWHWELYVVLMTLCSSASCPQTRFLPRKPCVVAPNTLTAINKCSSVKARTKKTCASSTRTKAHRREKAHWPVLPLQCISFPNSSMLRASMTTGSLTQRNSVFLHLLNSF